MPLLRPAGMRALPGERVPQVTRSPGDDSTNVHLGSPASDAPRGIGYPGRRVKADRFAPRVLKLVGEGQSYREISHRLGLSKNTVLDIVKRDRAA